MAVRRVEHFSKDTHTEQDIQSYVAFTKKDRNVVSCAYQDAGSEWVVTTLYR
jgi:hypothetical protein